MTEPHQPLAGLAAKDQEYQVRLEAEVARLLEALEKVAKWELPPSGEFYPNEDGTVSDRPAPYDSVFANGSQGARRYFQQLAAAALSAEPPQGESGTLSDAVQRGWYFNGTDAELIDYLRQGADDLHPYVVGEIDALEEFNVALPAFLNEAANRLAARTQAPETSDALGAWMSAALDDPAVCAEMKRDINAWFEAGQPLPPPPPEPRIARLEAERDAAYVCMIDVSSFLRGYGDAAEIAANKLVRAIPEDFDEREEAVRAALTAEPPK